VLEVFQKTQKPRSTKKNLGKDGLTPLKPKKAALFLQELVGHRAEIGQDRGQLKTFLDQCKQQDMLEVLLRGLLDLPTYELKTKMVSVFALVESHSLVFAMTLGDMLKRFFSLRSLISQPKLGLSEGEARDQTDLFVSEAGLLTSLCSLVNKICSPSTSS